MLDPVRDFFRNLDQLIWFGVVGAIVIVGGAVILLRSEPNADPEVVEMTMNAASTQSNFYVPTIAANLTQTPVDAPLTGAAPTLSLIGRQEVRQFAASAFATSERDSLTQGAVQAAGPPNTSECGDFRTAWATQDPNGRGSLTLLYAELVRPTDIIIYETYNPGFVTRVEFTDVYGGVHTVFERDPAPRGQCPFTLVIPIEDPDYEGNRVTIYLNQQTSAGGWNQIDAVELIGIKH